MAQCLMTDCVRQSRSRGYCDTHYRQVKNGHVSRDVGRPPMDRTVWKIRVKRARGAQPYYFSNREKAYARAEAEAEKGNLLYFAEYELKEQFL